GFLQGASGDLNPAGPDGELILSGGDADVRRIGAQLAEDVLQAMATSMTPVPACPLAAGSRTAAVPLQRVPSPEELRAQTSEPWVTGDWARKLLAAPERLVPEVPLRWGWLRLAQGLTLLSANAELVVEYALYVKSLASGSG